ncbi:MAG: DNA translocase FtsK [Flavobacteriia bacterium]|nr:DNA translocase FtsK [Flavobacteriia bacterium]
MNNENEYIRRGEEKVKPEPEIKAPKEDSKKKTKKAVDEEQKEKLNAKNPWERFRARYELKRPKAIIGGILLISGIFLFLSVTSYLFTWQEDQSKVLHKGFWSFIFEANTEEMRNWLGKFGAWFSHLLVYRWIGISSLVIPFLLFLLGIYNSFGYKYDLFPLRRTTIISLFFMFWSALFLGLFASHINFLGGAFGYFSNTWLNFTLGKIGNLFIQLLVLYIGCVVLFDFNFKDFLNRFKNINLIDDEASEESGKERAANDFHIINTIRDNEVKKDNLRETVHFDEDQENEFTRHTLDIEDDLEEDEDDEFEIEDNYNKTEDEFELSSTISSASINPSEDSDEFEIEVAQPADAAISEDEADRLRQDYGDYDPTLDLSGYMLPPIDLLKDYGSNTLSIDKGELEENKNKIVETLQNYKIEISKIKATVGPTVTLYEIIPAPGVRISKIKSLEDDIALNLAALGIRIIAPIPGKGTIGIEVPNRKRDMVSMRSLIASEKFQNSDFELPVVIGRTITNETFTFDLTKMPHLLVAGATGQGKSVGLNAILVSILYKKHPSQVKFVLVDPKKVELTLYNKIERHFLAKLPDSEDPIITDTSKVINTLNSLCIEMDTRYELLKEAQVRTIKEYNAKFIQRRLNPEKGHHYLPYIVVLIDEFADLIMTAGREVESPIARIAQLARAVGIHLIVATQRPSVNVITGMIKANFPARIAFRVQSKIDSRTILDSNGADQLIGMGDMLISTGNDLIRLQCGFVDTPEVDDICDFIGSQRAYPEAMLLPEYVGEGAGGEDKDFDINDIDPMFAEGARIIVASQQGSASLLQRKLKLGYNRAGRIVDQLEAYGIIGPHQGSKAREVLFTDIEQLNEYMSSKGING